MSSKKKCSLCGTIGTNKSSCQLNTKIQNAGAKPKGPNRKFKINIVMETPKVLGVFDFNRNNVSEPTWRKNPNPYKMIDASLCAKDVISWYKYIMTVKGGPIPNVGYYYSDYIGNFDIKHIKGNIFEVSYVLLNELEPDMIKPWEIADPDYRYIYPLMCQGTKYHVYATVHGSKAKSYPREKRSNHPLFRGPYNEAAKFWK